MDLPGKLICIFLITCLISCNDSKEISSDLSTPQKLESQISYEKAGPASLTPTTVQDFILWASGSSVDERELIREEIMKASQDEEVLDLLFAELEKASDADLGLKLIILSIIGEMRNPMSLEQLEEIIFQDLPEQQDSSHSVLAYRHNVEILSSKAVECAAYLKTELSNQLVLRTAAFHESRAVRSSAIDAYLYNHNEFEEVKTTLSQVVSPEDIIMIDRTRFVKNSNKETFDNALKRFYEKYPEEIAPTPEMVKPNSKNEEEIIDKDQRLNPPEIN